MRRGIRVLMSIALAVTMIGGYGLTARAATSYVTRAQFVYALDVALGISPVYPATPTFTDVPTSSPYYGYIEAAYQKGFIAGYSSTVFGVDGLLTREQMAKIEVIALGDSSQALQLMSAHSNFKDDAQIAAFARGYVLEAAQLGLIHGYPDGTFRPGAYVTMIDEAAFIRQLTAVAGQSTIPSSISVTASTTSAAVGQLVTLSAVVKDASGNSVTSAGVTYSVSPTGAVVSGNRMIATQPGLYIVRATAPNGVSGMTTVSIYGSPAAVRLSLAAPVVADGKMETSLQAAFVDQNGNVVTDAQGEVALYYIMRGGATELLNNSGTQISPTTAAAAVTDGATQTLVNGVATFTVEGGLVPGAQDTFEAVPLNSQGSRMQSLTAAQLTVTSVAETPTRLSVASPGYIATNTSSITYLTIQALDQAGEPLLMGSVPLTVSLSGPATFANGGTGQETYFYNGNGNPANPAEVEVGVIGQQGQQGTVTVTVSSPNLPTQTLSLAAVAVGAAAKIAVSTPSVASFSESDGATGIIYGVSIEDASGHPLAASDPLRIEVLRNGVIANNIRIDGYIQGSQGVIDYSAAQAGRFTITDDQSGANAGTYTVEVSDPNGILAAAPSVTFTETAGVATHLLLHASAYVPVSDPTTPVTATVQDAYGNTVPVDGMAITFQNDPSNSAPGITLSAANALTQDGVATVSATAPLYEGKAYVVDASASGIPIATASFTVVASVTGTLTVGLVDIAQGGDSSGRYVHSTTTAQASDTVQITITAIDGNGQPEQSPDAIRISFTDSGLIPEFSTGGALAEVGNTSVWTDRLTAGGTDTITAVAKQAGAVGITVQDTSTTVTVTGSAYFNVVAGNVFGYEIVDALGNNVSQTGMAVQAGVPVEVYVTPVDEYGNAAVLTATTTVALSDNGGGGIFSMNPGGPPITTVVIYAGETSQPVYYENPRTGTYRLMA